MVDFSLTEEQQSLQQLARDFAQKEMVPVAAHYDRTMEFPTEVIKKAWDIGLMNYQIPEKFGGLGLKSFDGCLIAEETGSACTGIGTAMEANMLAEAPVILAATDDQKNRFLRPMTEEFRLAAYCVTEPFAGSDVQGIKTVAKKTGNDYVLNGQKMWITTANYASWYFVLAYTDPAKGYKGMSAFLVPRDSDGIEVGKKEINMGQRCSDTRGIAFNNVKVPESNRVGNEGDGFKIAMGAFDHSRPIVAAAAVGLARSAMEHAVKYATERSTFGVPISKHQAIAFMIADMAKDIQAARWLTWHAAWKIDSGQRNTLEAAYAKSFAADTAMRVTTDAVQVHGGYGFNTEYPVEKLMRDAKIFQIYEGTSQIQRLIIAKEIFDRK
jgi:acyl-CoA dehydrogenase